MNLRARSHEGFPARVMYAIGRVQNGYLVAVFPEPVEADEANSYLQQERARDPLGHAGLAYALEREPETHIALTFDEVVRILLEHEKCRGMSK